MEIRESWTGFLPSGWVQGDCKTTTSKLGDISASTSLHQTGALPPQARVLDVRALSTVKFIFNCDNQSFVETSGKYMDLNLSFKPLFPVALGESFSLSEL